MKTFENLLFIYFLFIFIYFFVRSTNLHVYHFLTRPQLGQYSILLDFMIKLIQLFLT